MNVADIAQIRQRVEAEGPASWLIEGLWPSDGYGVLGAADKSGKSWAVLDLAVSVVTNTPWLGRFPTSFGPALIFAGEGGERSTVRRLDAIVRNRGGDLDDLTGLRIAFSVPTLKSNDQLTEVAEELEKNEPKLCVIDPLYLAAAGAKGSDLYAMGEALGGIQRVCQEAGTALVIVAHWNKGGNGTGADRFTGVGPGAWGRVLGSAAVERKVTSEAGESDVLLRWEFSGGEIADQSFRMRRKVKAADPADLGSPLIYEASVEEGPAEPGDSISRSERRICAALLDQRELSVKQIGDIVAHDGTTGKGLFKTTIQHDLAELERLGLVEGTPFQNGQPRYWSGGPK